MGAKHSISALSSNLIFHECFRQKDTTNLSQYHEYLNHFLYSSPYPPPFHPSFNQIYSLISQNMFPFDPAKQKLQDLEMICKPHDFLFNKDA